MKNQVAQLQRERHYDDDLQHYDFPPPSNTPGWSYNSQSGLTYDSEWEKNEDYDEEVELLNSQEAGYVSDMRE
jgi:hypothetical protein